MKKLILIFLILNVFDCLAQTEKYIVFEKTALFNSVSISKFKLRYNHVLLNSKSQDKREFNIFNMYFSKNNFNTAAIDKEAFRLGSLDFTKLNNDILITISPVDTSSKLKLDKLSPTEFKKYAIIDPKDLLQDATTNLYRSFIKDEIANSNNNSGQIKTRKYGLIIKDKKEYYLVKSSSVLTEFYLVDDMSYLFPNQYHFGEISTSTHTKFYTIQDIIDLREKYNSLHLGFNNPLFSDMMIPIGIDTIQVPDFRAIRYATLPPIGTGIFQFINGIGIINGSYDSILNKNYQVNHDIDLREAGKIFFQLKAINDEPVKIVLDSIKALNKGKFTIEL